MPTNKKPMERGQLGCALSSECNCLNGSDKSATWSQLNVTYQGITTCFLATSSPNRLLMQQKATREHLHMLTTHTYADKQYVINPFWRFWKRSCQMQWSQWYTITQCSLNCVTAYIRAHFDHRAQLKIRISSPIGILFLSWYKLTNSYRKYSTPIWVRQKRLHVLQ